MGKQWKQWETIFLLGSKITVAMKLRDTCSLEESYDQPKQHIKKQRHHFASKAPSSQSYGFFSSHVWIWELDYKESWEPMNLCFYTVVLEKIIVSPLDWKEIQPVNPEGNQSWIFIGRTDAEAETPILWSPDAKNWLIRKDLVAWKDWRQEEKGMTEDEMVGWHHWLDGHEFVQVPGVGDGQGILVCYSPWGHKVSDMSDRLHWLNRWKEQWNVNFLSLTKHLSNHKAIWQQVSTNFYWNKKKTIKNYSFLYFFISTLEFIVTFSVAYFYFLSYLQLMSITAD